MTTRKGVVLLNMGGPDSLESVRPFLFNLFSDRDIIKLGPPFLQKFIAWQIARKRAPKSCENYRKIGGKSGLREITFAQAEALEKSLSKHGDYRVTVAMRYWEPYTDEALDQLEAYGADEIIALTLYPHYSRATTGSSVKELEKKIAKRKLGIPHRIIDSYPAEPNYIEAVASGILQVTEKLRRETTSDVQVIYSAHSLPTSFIEEGDPYVNHLAKSIAAIEALTKRKGILCYQSRSGPVEWLAPSTPDTIKQLAKDGCEAIVMVPISFVSDHIETLYEIDMLYREMAENLGMHFAMSNSLNTNPLFIEGLTQLVLWQG